MRYEDESFEGQAIRLDRNQFLNCTFENVAFEYGGGPIEMMGSKILGVTRWMFDGSLGTGLATLGMLFEDGKSEALKVLVRNMFARGHASATAVITPKREILFSPKAPDEPALESDDLAKLLGQPNLTLDFSRLSGMIRRDSGLPTSLS